MTEEEILKQFEKELGYYPYTTSDCELTNWLIERIVNLTTKNLPDCGNENAPCAPNLKYGTLVCDQCDWSE